jgi:DNA-binding IclR family transcriptional regulator
LLPRADRDNDLDYVPALARGLSILRCFTRYTPVLGTAEISRITALPHSTVCRLCHTLLREGYLVKDNRAGKLRPGFPLLSLGSAAVADDGSMQAIKNFSTATRRHNEQAIID